jgi:hypothetical protein
VSETSDSMHMIFLERGRLPWNAASQVQSL